VSLVKRILVTGGAGFLGSHLCDRLVAQGHDVICLDNFFTSQKANIEHLLGRPNFELIRHDVVHPMWLEVDEVYNLACPAAPGHYQYNPIKTMKTSVMGAINMLGLAKRCRAKVLQASTSEVYGDPEVHPQPESYKGSVNTLGPRACYDEGKRAAETLFMDYHRMHRVNIRIVRIFNTFGPRMHPYDGRVVSNFIRQALRGEDITIYGDGAQTRSFCYCDDLVDGIIRMMNGPDEFVGPVNLGNPGEFTILELAQIIKDLSGSPSKIVFRPAVADDPMQRQPAIDLAQKWLGGWEPKVNLREGLARTIDWFRSIDITTYPELLIDLDDNRHRPPRPRRCARLGSDASRPGPGVAHGRLRVARGGVPDPGHDPGAAARGVHRARAARRAPPGVRRGLPPRVRRGLPHVARGIPRGLARR
jgi:UDP-glucuronate decarboxylase